MRVIILAAGKGTRMHMNIPKCIVPINETPMISYLIDTFEKMECPIYIIVGYKQEQIKLVTQKKVFYIEQKEQLGTAHAVLSAKPLMEKLLGLTLIVPGDMPLVSEKTIKQLMIYHQKKNNDLTLLVTNKHSPYGYGRIVKNELGKIIKIVEEKDATKEEKEIKTINTGIYLINNQVLFNNIEKIKNNNVQKEYYLTDLVEILLNEYQVDIFEVPDSMELIGINDQNTLKKVEEYLNNE